MSIETTSVQPGFISLTSNLTAVVCYTLFKRVHINDVQLPQSDDVKYLGLHLDRRLTWHKHIFTKRKQLGVTLTKMYWLLGRQSHLSTSNKLLLYKTILKPIWTYGIQLWGTASTSNIEILERFQSKALRMIVDAPWYVFNTFIRRDLHISTVKEIRRFSSHYGARLRTHPNHLAANLLGLPTPVSACQILMYSS
jgi:hypothetical protein